MRLTTREYDEIVQRGAFDRLRKGRIELIYGELRERPPNSPPHSHITSKLNRWSVSNTTPESVEVRIQQPVAIPEADSEPEPDVAWASPVSSQRHPLPHEIALLIEVSSSTLADDLGEKAGLYSAAGIADYWVVDVDNKIVHVFREPTPSGYRRHEQFREGEVRPLARGSVALKLSELFGD